MIDSPEAERLANELSRYTGETVNQAVISALRERLQRQQLIQQSKRPLSARLLEIGQECASLPVLDNRTPRGATALVDEVW
jgi:antitoxin VapB